MNTIVRTTTTDSTNSRNTSPPPPGSRRAWLSRVTMPPGRRATMLAKMISEVPLPTPRLVICSPSHITNIVPPVRVTTVEAMKNGTGRSTMPLELARPMAMPNDWNMARATVR